MSFRFNYDSVKYRIRNTGRLKQVLSDIVSEAGLKPGQVNIILTDDNSLRKINNDFLKHDYYTDVISFGYGDDKLMEGEIYVSVDTVRINAKLYSVTFREELYRVIIHGVLHLSGLDDSTEEERSAMREKEDFWLRRLSGITDGQEL